MEALGVRNPDVLTRVSEYIPEVRAGGRAAEARGRARVGAQWARWLCNGCGVAVVVALRLGRGWAGGRT